MTSFLLFNIFLVMILCFLPVCMMGGISGDDSSNAFECGFDSVKTSRLPFSSQFYLISLIFLIFDMELAILIPLTWFSTTLQVIITFMLFLVFVLAGWFYEWREGTLSWNKA